MKLLNIKLLLMLPVILLCIISQGNVNCVNAASNQKDLLEYWAPEVYHGVTTNYDSNSDAFTKVDYDGDYIGNNNWENMNKFDKPAYTYTSFHETLTHYYLGYYFFHPRDEGLLDTDKHENDLEGILLVIKKNDSTYGLCQLMETNAHGHWYQYTNDTNITSGNDNIDGHILFNGSHPKIYIQANEPSPWGDTVFLPTMEVMLQQAQELFIDVKIKQML